MKSMIVVIMPVGVAEADAETALCRIFKALDKGPAREEPPKRADAPADEAPFWTWFLPNPTT
jgi:hypothetical protein